MISELLKALSLIFMAEMGDKTQIIAMTFATQFTITQVLSGVAIGVFFNHGMAIILGSILGSLLNPTYLDLVSGGLFIFFGYNALKLEESEDITSRKALSPIKVVALAFFIGELGDKTQLSALALSADATYPFMILIGTTIGMVLVSSLGILVGSKLGGRIPEVGLKIASSLVFIGFGSLRFFNGVSVLVGDSVAFLGLIIILVSELALIFKLLGDKKRFPEKLALTKAAVNLYNHVSIIHRNVDSLCLGEGSCGTCLGDGCLMGYTRNILKSALENEDYFNPVDVEINNLIKRDYDDNRLKDAYAVTLMELSNIGWRDDSSFVITKVRQAFELLLFKTTFVHTENSSEYLKELSKHDKVLAKSIKNMLAREDLYEAENI